MSYARLLDLARAKGMFVSVKTRTSRDLRQFEVVVHARSLSDAGAKPAFVRRFAIEFPFSDAIDVVADMAWSHFDQTSRATSRRGAALKGNAGTADVRKASTNL